MKEIPFIGGAYEEDSKQAGPQDCKNLYMKKDDVGGRHFLFGTPGLSTNWAISGPPGEPGPDSCDTPVIEEILNSSMWLYEVQVLEIETHQYGYIIYTQIIDEVIYGLTRAVSGDGGRIVFEDTAYDIDWFNGSFGGRWGMRVSSLPSGLEVGDTVVVESNDSLDDFPHREWLHRGAVYPTLSVPCLTMSVYYLNTGNCPAFLLQFYSENAGAWADVRYLTDVTFAWYGCWSPDTTDYLRVQDAEGNQSGSLELACTASIMECSEGNPETILRGHSAEFAWTGGHANFSLELSGTGFWFDAGYTQTTTTQSGRTVTVYADGTACGEMQLKITDACEYTHYCTARCDQGQWVRQVPDLDCRNSMAGYVCGDVNSDALGYPCRISGSWKQCQWIVNSRSVLNAKLACGTNAYDCTKNVARTEYTGTYSRYVYCYQYFLTPGNFSALCHDTYPTTICMRRPDNSLPTANWQPAGAGVDYDHCDVLPHAAGVTYKGFFGGSNVAVGFQYGNVAYGYNETSETYTDGTCPDDILTPEGEKDKRANCDASCDCNADFGDSYKTFHWECP